MFTVIFGRPGCPYCVRAKELAEKYSLPYIETSAYTAQNVKESIEMLLEKVMSRMERTIGKTNKSNQSEEFRSFSEFPGFNIQLFTISVLNQQ